MVVAFKTARKCFFLRRTPAKVYGNLKTSWSPSQPFLVSSRNAPPHKRLLTFKQHSFPFVVFTPIRSLTLFSMRPIKSQNIVNNVVFPALSSLFSNSRVLEGCSHSLKRSEFLQWGIRQRKFCKAIVASFVPQKFQKKKKNLYIW